MELAQSENMMQHIGEYFIDADRTGRAHGPGGNRHVSPGLPRVATAAPVMIGGW